MTLEMIVAFLAGALVVLLLLVFRGNAQTTAPYSPTSWLRDAARSGVIIKAKASETEGEWVLSFELSENLEELNRLAQELCDAGRKVDAIKLVRRRLDLDLREAKEHVEAL